MIHYVHLKTLAVRSIDEIRALHPNASLPVNANCDVLGYAPLVDTPYPVYNRFTEAVRNATPVNVEGVWQQRWEVYPLPAEDVEANTTALKKQQRQEAKAARASAVQAITVTTAAGNTFDGSENSQNRMARAIITLSAGHAASVPWVLADNSVTDATAAELTEALALAGLAQAAIWPIKGDAP